MPVRNGEWGRKKAQLIRAVTRLGFPGDLGEAAAEMLGSPRAMNRLIGYLNQARPKKIEQVADEILAIRMEIDKWRAKKESEEANRKINEMLWRGFGDDDSEE